MGSFAEVDLSSQTLPNRYSARDYSPVGVVMHTTSGSDSYPVLSGVGTTEKAIRSAHVLVARDGTRTIIVAADKCAFHTGTTWLAASQSNRMDYANEIYLGVEVECLDTQTPTWQQYDSVADYITNQALHWAWRWPYIMFGHYALATPLGRRSDPVRFDWGALMGRLFVHTRNKNIGGL